MKRITTTALALLAWGVPVAAPVVANGTSSAPHVVNAGMYGIKIVNYKVNKDHSVTLSVAIRGLKMGAMGKKKVTGSGHWNIVVAGKVNNFSVNAKTGRTKILKKGDYTVYAVLVNNDGSPLSEPTRSKSITVMVG